MQISLSLGVAFCVAVGFLKATRRLSWPSLFVTFTAGVLMASSALGLLAARAAESGAQVAQTGVAAVQDAANQATRPAPAAARHPAPRTTGTAP